jgi:CRP/FNR family cyclic AMP-dependent transcriptional regulator
VDQEENLGGRNFFSFLGEGEREILFAEGGRRRFPSGGMLMYERQLAEEVFVLLEGRVKITHTTPEGREIVLNFCGPGEMIGEMAALEGGTRSSTVEALEPVEALAIAAGRFRVLLESNPGLSTAVLSSVSARFVDANRRLVEFAAAHTLARVASRLLELCDRYGESVNGGAVRIGLPISQTELAGWVGSSREAVAKALQTLRELGVIETERRRILVRQVEELQRQSATT